MCARVTKSGERLFLYSPFRNSTSQSAGRPPVVALDEQRCKGSTSAYIEEEMVRFESGRLVPDFELQKYLTWSSDGDRAVVSFDTSCDLPCKFCYVESLVERQETPFVDMSNLGILLAQFVIADRRFTSGKRGTVIFIGKLTEPFHERNRKATASFLDEPEQFDVKNLIHIATRLLPSVENDGRLLRHFSKNNVLLDFLVSVLSDNIELHRDQIIMRFDSAKKLLGKGVHVSMYLRPVIPGLTEKDIPEIVKLLRERDITSVTVGDLYMDTRISSKLDIPINEELPNKYNSRMILDSDGLLRKANVSETERIRRIFREYGFDVYRSAYDLARAQSAD